MPNLTKSFLEKVYRFQPLNMQYFYAKKNTVSTLDFLRQQTDNIATEESPEKALLSAIAFNQYIRANSEDPEDEILKDAPKEDIEVYVNIANIIINKNMTESQKNALFDAMDSHTLKDLEWIGEDGTYELTTEAKERKAEEEKENRIEEEKKEREAQERKTKEDIEAKEHAELEKKARENVDKKYKDAYEDAQRKFQAQDEYENPEKPNEMLFDGRFFASLDPYEIKHKFEVKEHIEESQRINPAKMAAQIRQDNDEKNQRDVNFFNDKQRTIAQSRFSCYFGLRCKLENQSFLDILKHPIEAIKERIQLRGAKNDIQKNYGFNDTAIDTMFDLVMKTPTDIESIIPEYSQAKIPDSFGFINKDGTIQRKTAPQEEYQQELEKLEKELANTKENEQIIKEMKERETSPETQEEMQNNMKKLFKYDPNVTVNGLRQSPQEPVFHDKTK